MEKLKKILNRIFIDGLGGMALGLFSTLIIGTIIAQIGTFIGGDIGSYINGAANVAKTLTGAGIGVGVADNRDIGGVNERLDAAAKEREAAGLLNLVRHAKGRLAQTPVDGQRLHGEQSVGGHGYLGLGELVCELDLGEIDRGDDVLVNLGGHIDGGLVVCRGRRVEGAGADEGVDAFV